MATPTKEELQNLLKNHTRKGKLLVPVFLEIKADLLTPVSAYLKLSAGQQHSFLFESVEGGARIGRYSFLGAGPVDIIKTGQQFEYGKVDPLKVLEKRFESMDYIRLPNTPNFTGGAVGYVSFDCIEYFEPRTKKELKDVLGIPESQFMFFEEAVVFDHLHHVIKIICHFKPQGNDTFDEEEYNRVVARLNALKDLLETAEVVLPKNSAITGPATEWHSNVGQEGYESFVGKLKTHIIDGDIVQAVPSQRVSRKTFLHPFNAYRELRSINPSPYMFYLDCEDFQVVGASPEMLCKVENRKVYTHPIAGTRRRGKTQQEDEELAKDLLNDEKERAEHVMLVDLGRNDVNRVCIPSSTSVDSLMQIERYSHVMHIVSQVSGTLRPEKSQWDAFRSIFPAGTVSGAPKIKAIELIRECEQENRGVYAGSVGYFGYGGNLDTAIAIRTSVFKDGNVYLQAGGGIVYDSDPFLEYQETTNKLGSSMAAIARAEAFYQRNSH